MFGLPKEKGRKEIKEEEVEYYCPIDQSWCDEEVCKFYSKDKKDCLIKLWLEK